MDSASGGAQLYTRSEVETRFHPARLPVFTYPETDGEDSLDVVGYDTPLAGSLSDLQALPATEQAMSQIRTYLDKAAGMSVEESRYEDADWILEDSEWEDQGPFVADHGWLMV